MRIGGLRATTVSMDNIRIGDEPVIVETTDKGIVRVLKILKMIVKTVIRLPI